MYRRESCRICKHRSIGKSVAEKERPILLNAECMINEEKAKSSLLILTHHIQKPLNHLFFSGFTGMDLRGIEPLGKFLTPVKSRLSDVSIATVTTRGQTQHIEKEENSVHLLQKTMI